MNNLAEDRYGHGGIRENILSTNIRRLMRPKHEKLGNSPAPFDWVKGVERDFRRKDQGTNFSCGFQSGSRWLQIFLQGNPDISAKGGYSQGYAAGGGMSKASLESVMCRFPCPLESEVPSYDASGAPLSESMMREQSWKTDSFSRSFQDFVPVTVRLDKESIAQAIRDTGGVILLIGGQNGNPRDWRSACPQPPSASNRNEVWWHYLCLTGAKASYPKPLRADQSWGESVGDRGWQYFDEEYLDSGYVTDAFTFIPKGTLADQKKDIMQKLLVLCQRMLAFARSDARISR